MLGKGFYTLIKSVRSSFQSMWNITIHPPSKPSVLVGTHSFLQLMWDSEPYQSFPPQPMWNIKIHPFKAHRPSWHSFLSLIDVRPLLNIRVQHSRWYPFLSQIDVGSLQNPPSSGPSVLTGTPPRVYHPFGERPPSLRFPFRASPQGFKLCLLGKGFHTLKECFVMLPNQYRISQFIYIYMVL